MERQSREPHVLALVKPEHVGALWPAIADLVARACVRSGGRYRPQDVQALCRSGDWQLWIVAKHGAVVFAGATQIVPYPTGLKALAWRFGTGSDRSEWQHLMTQVLDWARAQGCAMAEGSFRIGWRRVFKDWRHTHEFLELEL